MSDNFQMKRITASIFLLSLLIKPTAAWAVNMSSEHYKIQWGNMNIGSGNLQGESDPYGLGVTMGELTPGYYSKNGYIVRSGFQYIHSIIPFSFTITNLELELGNLSPETPSTAYTDLKVRAGGAGGYQVLVYQDHDLRSFFYPSVEDIPKTSCDNSDCNKDIAGVWQQNTTYGFGINMSGSDIPLDFAGSTYYRALADKEKGETPAELMFSENVTSLSEARATFKANISSLQSAGNYENSIIFIAVPGY